MGGRDIEISRIGRGRVGLFDEPEMRGRWFADVGDGDDHPHEPEETVAHAVIAFVF